MWGNITLREKCPNTEFFLVHVFPCSLRIQENMDQKKLRIWKNTFHAVSLILMAKNLLGKGVLKICSKFTGEHSCGSAISIKLQSNFNEITLRHGCSPVNLLHFFGTPFLKITSGWLLLNNYFLVFVVNIGSIFHLSNIS